MSGKKFESGPRRVDSREPLGATGVKADRRDRERRPPQVGTSSEGATHDEPQTPDWHELLKVQITHRPQSENPSDFLADVGVAIWLSKTTRRKAA